MADKYTSLANVVILMGERHAINCSVERSGATIGDADVITRIEEMIEYVSRETDGYLRGHTPVPIAEVDVPDDLEVLIRGYVAYRMWARRGRYDDKNPHNDGKKLYFERIKQVQKGRWRFETAGGDEVAEKPVEYETDRPSDDLDRTSAGRKFTDRSMGGFTNP